MVFLIIGEKRRFRVVPDAGVEFWTTATQFWSRGTNLLTLLHSIFFLAVLIPAIYCMFDSDILPLIHLTLSRLSGWFPLYLRIPYLLWYLYSIVEMRYARHVDSRDHIHDACILRWCCGCCLIGFFVPLLQLHRSIVPRSITKQVMCKIIATRISVNRDNGGCNLNRLHQLEFVKMLQSPAPLLKLAWLITCKLLPLENPQVMVLSWNTLVSPRRGFWHQEQDLEIVARKQETLGFLTQPLQYSDF